jgi:hypothetical protein
MKARVEPRLVFYLKVWQEPYQTAYQGTRSRQRPGQEARETGDEKRGSSWQGGACHRGEGQFVGVDRDATALEGHS